jgi:transcriptional regulator with XRE-family HTH domain
MISTMPLNIEYIRQRREQLGLSLEDAAKAADLKGGRQKWWNLEAGNIDNPKLETVYAIAKALQCKVAKLIKD